MNDSFPQRLTGLRLEHGLSQEQLSAQLGVSRQAISKWERGESTPDMDNLIALATLYDLSLDEMVYGVVEKAPAEDCDQGSEALASDETSAEGDEEATQPGLTAPDATQPAANDPTGPGSDLLPSLPDNLSTGEAPEASEGGFAAEAAPADSEPADEGTASNDGVAPDSAADSPSMPGQLLATAPAPEGVSPEATSPEEGTYEPDEGATHEYVRASAAEDAFTGDYAGGGTGATTSRRRPVVQLVSYPILCTLVFLLLGICFALWHPAWMLFLTIPLYELSAGSFDERRPLDLVSYAILVTFTFLALGFSFGLWHPAWVLFLTIPIYEAWKRRGGGSFTGRQVAGTVAALMLLALVMTSGRRAAGRFFDGHWSLGWGDPLAAEAESTSGENEATELVDAASIRDLSIDWRAGSVSVVTDSDKKTEGKIRVREKSPDGWRDTPHMEIAHEGGTLDIKYGKGDGALTSCSATRGKSLTVVLPESCAKELDSVRLDGSSVDFEVAEITCHTLQADLSSGSFTARDSAVHDLVVDLSSGDMDFDGSVESTIGLDVASGTIALRSDIVPTEANIDVGSGDVQLLLPEDAGFTAQVDMASGTFSSDFETRQQGDRYVAGDGRMTIDADIASGKLQVSKR